jgi:hypothetical protein
MEETLEYETSFGIEVLEMLAEADEEALEEENFMVVVESDAIRSFFKHFPQETLYQVILGGLSEFYIKREDGKFVMVFSVVTEFYF